jgi:anti-anti-sigma regulatory factor
VIHDLEAGTAVAVVSEDVFFSTVAMPEVSSKAVVYAGDYLNKLSGESVERECRQKIADGARELIVDFSRTEIVNSIGVSILLGVIDAAKSSGATVAFADVNEGTAELFEMLGVTNHVRLIHN